MGGDGAGGTVWVNGTVVPEGVAGNGEGGGMSGGDGIGEAAKGVVSKGPCLGGMAGAVGESGGPTFVVMATATVIGVVACTVPVGGVADETSTNRAVFWRLASGGG